MGQTPHVTLVNQDDAVIGPTTPLSVAQGIFGTDILASDTVAANTAVSVVLPALASKTTYLAGFSITVDTGAAGPTGLATITGLSATLNYRVGGAAAGAGLREDFHRPIPASAPNTAITLSVPALGPTTGAVAVIIRGFHL